MRGFHPAEPIPDDAIRSRADGDFGFTLEGRAAVVPDPEPDLEAVYEALHRSRKSALGAMLERMRGRFGAAAGRRTLPRRGVRGR